MKHPTDEKGRLHGIIHEYWSNHKPMRKTVYHHGKKHGPHKGYSSSGQQYLVGTYKNDRRLGLWAYKDGEKHVSEAYHIS